ncbi:hypothetical protein K439DRAFT_1632854 [Ramaria rubella]|nr:hypothetical protein K439DRAFT_1632854 [Ramaria rubella]
MFNGTDNGLDENERNQLKSELKDASRRLQDTCARLQEIIKEREEEIQQWEEEMERLLEESARRQREAEVKEFIAQMFGAQEESASANLLMKEAWIRYEDRWQSLRTVSSGLTFCTIPWPVVTTVTLPESLASHLISQFILSPDHSPTESRRRRIHAALLRWHSDHFDVKIMHKVVESEREAVREGVARVVRCLNEMLAWEGS